MPDLTAPLIEAGAYVFDDFDQFRASIRGWECDPVQLSCGPLRLAHDYLRIGNVSIDRIRVNQRIADLAATAPGRVLLVVALSQGSYCGLPFPSGSLLIIGGAREHRSVLSADWESIEIGLPESHLQGMDPALDDAALEPGLQLEDLVAGQKPRQALAAGVFFEVVQLVGQRRGAAFEDVSGIGVHTQQRNGRWVRRQSYRRAAAWLTAEIGPALRRWEYDRPPAGRTRGNGRGR